MILWFVLLVITTASQWTAVQNNARFSHNAGAVEFKISDYSNGFKVQFYGDTDSYIGYVELRPNWEDIWKWGVGIGSCQKSDVDVGNDVPVSPDTVWRIWIGETKNKFNLKADGKRIASRNCGAMQDIKKWQIEVFGPVSNLVIEWRPIDSSNTGK